MANGRVGIGVALGALLLTTSLSADARAETDEEVLRELRALRERVQELEARDAAREADALGRDELSAAVETYLRSRGDEGPTGGAVFAPRSRKIELGGMVRVRGEMKYRTPQGPDADGRHTNEYVLGRTRLHARADIERDLGAYVELQDARIWGSESSTAADGDGVDLSQGYVDFRNLWCGSTDVRLGRQSVALSDQRFIGHLEWANQARRFDGVTVTHRAEDSVHRAFWYRTAEGFPFDASDDDQDLAGVWSTFAGVLGERTTGELFAIHVNDTRKLGVNGEHTGFWTYGFRAHGTPDGEGFDWDVQGALQSGDLDGDDLDAWAIRGAVGYRMGDTPGASRIGVEVDWATGDETAGDGDSEQFQVLFPTNHGYYGIHDLAAWSNQRAWSVNYSVGIAEGVTFKAAFWKFRVDEKAGGWVSASGAPIRLPHSDGGRSLGSELDLILRWKQSERVTWELGWAHFDADSYARNASPSASRGSDFVYLQSLITF